MTDAVLIAVIITIAILAFGGISVLVILLFMKWKGYMKTRNRGIIQIAEVDRERTHTREQHTRARPGNRNNTQTGTQFFLFAVCYGRTISSFE